MSIHKKAAQELCAHCSQPKITTHLKSMFIDDFITECENVACDKHIDGLQILRGLEYGAAKEESKRNEDRQHARDHEDFYANREWKE
jgi:hypothetical protein